MSFSLLLDPPRSVHFKLPARVTRLCRRRKNNKMRGTKYQLPFYGCAPSREKTVCVLPENCLLKKRAKIFLQQHATVKAPADKNGLPLKFQNKTARILRKKIRAQSCLGKAVALVTVDPHSRAAVVPPAWEWEQESPLLPLPVSICLQCVLAPPSSWA